MYYQLFFLLHTLLRLFTNIYVSRRRADISLYSFVSGYYKQQTLLETYATPIAQLPHPDEWNIPSDIASVIIQPPDVTRQAGRPRMSRARAAVEHASTARRVQVCTKCKGIGHNRRSCTSLFPTDAVEFNVLPNDSNVQQSTQGNPRKKKKCSVCHSVDHTRPKCPMRTD